MPPLSANLSELVRTVPVPGVSTEVPMAVMSFTAVGEPNPPQFCVDGVKCNPPKYVSMDITQARLKMVVAPASRATICFTVKPRKLPGSAPTCALVSSDEIGCGIGSYTYVANDTVSEDEGIDLRPHAITVRSLDIAVLAIACNWGGPSKVSEV